VKPAVACWQTSQGLEAVDIGRRGPAVDDRAPERILHPETAVLKLFRYTVGMPDCDLVACHVDLVTGRGIDMTHTVVALALAGSRLAVVAVVAVAVITVAITAITAIAAAVAGITAAAVSATAATTVAVSTTAVAAAIATTALAGLCAGGMDPGSGAVEVNLIGSDDQRQRGGRSERQPATTGRDRSVHPDLRRFEPAPTLNVAAATNIAERRGSRKRPPTVAVVTQDLCKRKIGLKSCSYVILASYERRRDRRRRTGDWLSRSRTAADAEHEITSAGGGGGDL
jgi:hypothetical protein